MQRCSEITGNDFSLMGLSLPHKHYMRLLDWKKIVSSTAGAYRCKGCRRRKRRPRLRLAIIDPRSLNLRRESTCWVRRTWQFRFQPRTQVRQVDYEFMETVVSVHYSLSMQLFRVLCLPRLPWISDTFMQIVIPSRHLPMTRRFMIWSNEKFRCTDKR